MTPRPVLPAPAAGASATPGCGQRRNRPRRPLAPLP